MSKSSHDLRVTNLNNKINDIIRNLILSEVHKFIYFKDNISVSDLWNSWWCHQQIILSLDQHIIQSSAYNWRYDYKFVQL